MEVSSERRKNAKTSPSLRIARCPGVGHRVGELVVVSSDCICPLPGSGRPIDGTWNSALPVFVGLCFKRNRRAQHRRGLTRILGFPSTAAPQPRSSTGSTHTRFTFLEQLCRLPNIL